MVSEKDSSGSAEYKGTTTPFSQEVAKEYYERGEQIRALRHATNLATIALGLTAGAIGYTSANLLPIEMAIAFAQDKHGLNSQMSDLTQVISDSRVYVNCDTDMIDNYVEYAGIGEISGFVPLIQVLPEVHIAPPITTLRELECVSLSLDNLTLAENIPPEEAFMATLLPRHYTDAMHTLLHEIEHTKGVLNEAEANCNAMQKLPGALKEAGANQAFIDETVPYVQQLLHQYSPEEYLDREKCRADGEYDLGIGGPFIESLYE